MGTTPDELKEEVQARRAHLARNVDRLADKVTPSRMAQRRVQAVQDRWYGMRERVMGTSQETGRHLAQQATGSVQQATDTLTSTAGQVGEKVQRAPQAVRRQTQGSPLAAGLIAFGAGALAAALLPTTSAEKQAAGQLVDHADSLVEPVKQAALDSARDVRENLREPVSQAREAVVGTAQDAAGTTKDEAVAATRHTGEGLRDTATQGSGSDPGQRDPGDGVVRVRNLGAEALLTRSAPGSVGPPRFLRTRAGGGAGSCP